MIVNYLKITWKMLWRRKFFTTISLFGISFTLTVLLVITALFDHSLAAHAPEVNATRTLYSMNVHLRDEHTNMYTFHSYYFLNTYLKRLQTPELVSIYSQFSFVPVYPRGKKIDLALKLVDGEYWQMRAFTFLEGKAFLVKDVQAENMVAVINRKTKAEYFGSTEAVGEYIEINSNRYRIIGVVEDVSISKQDAYADVWVPVSTAKLDLTVKTFHGWFMASILARRTADFPVIRREYESLLKQIDFSEADHVWTTFESPLLTKVEILSSIIRYALTGGREFRRGSSIIFYAIMTLLMIFFMTLPALNLVNLNLSRIMERSSEIGIRKAFGASKLSLLGQFTIENVILTSLGGILSLVFALIILQLLTGNGLVPLHQVQINVRIFFIGFQFCLFFGVFAGIYPAWRMSCLHPVDAMRGGRS